MKMNTKRIVLVVFLLILFGAMMGRYLQRVPKRHYCDFRVYYHAAQVFLKGGDIYLRDEEEITAFRYSPFFAFIFAPLGLMSIKGAAVVFFGINFLCTFLLYYLSKKDCVDHPLSSWKTFWIYFLVMVFVSRFVLLVWDSGQVNIVMCALIVGGLYFLSKGKEAWAAFLLAASILFKFTSAIFIPYLIIKKRFKAVFWAGLFLVVLSLLPALFVGWAKNIVYLKSCWPAISTTLWESSYSDYKNQSLFAMSLRLIYPSKYGINFLNLSFHPALMVSYAVGCFLYLWALVPGKKNKDEKADHALLFIFLAFFNPNGWMINYVSLVFPYFFVLNYLFKVKGKDAFVFIGVSLSFILTSWLSQDVVGNSLEELSEVFSVVTIGSLFLTAAILKIKFFPSRMLEAK